MKNIKRLFILVVCLVLSFSLSASAEYNTPDENYPEMTGYACSTCGGDESTHPCEESNTQMRTGCRTCGGRTTQRCNGFIRMESFSCGFVFGCIGYKFVFSTSVTCVAKIGNEIGCGFSNPNSSHVCYYEHYSCGHFEYTCPF